MRVLGVDPGLTRCGLGTIESTPSRKVQILDVRVLRTSKDTPTPQRLAELYTQLTEHVEAFQLTVLALEQVFSYLNVNTVMGTAQASAMAMLVAQQREIPVVLYTPTEVKAAVTGYGSAEKQQVSNMVQKILRLKSPPKPADAADALAIAITHAWRGSGQQGNTANSMTAAQRLWREAEKSASLTRKHPRLK